MQSIKSENTRNELGAVALCVSSMVAFLSAAAFTKAGFSQLEWWLFVFCGGAWISYYASNFFTLHHYRFKLAEQGKIIDRYRDLVSAKQALIVTQNEVVSLHCPLVKQAAVSGVTPEEKPTKQHGNPGAECVKNAINS